MLNLFKRSTTKREGHAAGGCGCGSHHTHAPAPDAAARADEGCCSGRGAKAVEERIAAETDHEHASRQAHGSCCGEHSATVPAGQPTVHGRGR